MWKVFPRHRSDLGWCHRGPLPPSDLSCCQPCTPVLRATAGNVQQGSCWLTAPQVTLDVQREGAVSTSSAQNRPVSVSGYYNNSQSVKRGSYLSQHPPRPADLQPNVESVADLEVASPVINRAQFCPNFCIWKGHTDICDVWQTAQCTRSSTAVRGDWKKVFHTRTKVRLLGPITNICRHLWAKCITSTC